MAKVLSPLRLTALLGGLLVAIVFCPIAGASSPETAPPELKQLLSQLDAAANRQDLNAVMQFYSSNFVHGDGLSRQTLEQSLQRLWQSYSKLVYRTELRSWQREGDLIIAEIVTQMTGVQRQGDREFQFEATLRSRQHMSGQQIVWQEILAERSQLRTGNKPPTVEVKLPEQVATGESFSFDAIVQEPLTDGFLLGAITEEPVRPNLYFASAPADLVALQAGGLFKIGRASPAPDQRWISALLIRRDGMTLVTNRLRIVKKK